MVDGCCSYPLMLTGCCGFAVPRSTVGIAVADIQLLRLGLLLVRYAPQNPREDGPDGFGFGLFLRRVHQCICLIHWDFKIIDLYESRSI